jgi:lysophospholipase L1-like esterase
MINNRYEDTINWTTPFKEFELILTRAKETVNNWDGKLIFLYMPDYQEYVKPFESNLSKQEVLDIVRRLDIPIIDGNKDIFDMHNTPLSLFPFGLDLHFNKDGYKLLTDGIIENLTNKD